MELRGANYTNLLLTADLCSFIAQRLQLALARCKLNAKTAKGASLLTQRVTRVKSSALNERLYKVTASAAAQVSLTSPPGHHRVKIICNLC